MKELEQLLVEVKEWRAYHHNQALNGVKGAQIEALACAIRERALLDAKQAIERERAGS